MTFDPHMLPPQPDDEAEDEQPHSLDIFPSDEAGTGLAVDEVLAVNEAPADDDRDEENPQPVTAFPDHDEEDMVGNANEMAEAAAYPEEPVVIPEDDGEFSERRSESYGTPWERIKSLFGGGSGESLTRRLIALDERIDAEPEAAGNYVLRGELFLHLRDYERAYADFQRGLERAQVEYASSDWGIVAQAMQDRALMGLARAERKLQASGQSIQIDNL